MRMEQVNELKSDLEKVTNDTMMWKEKYYEQVSCIIILASWTFGGCSMGGNVVDSELNNMLTISVTC